MTPGTSGLVHSVCGTRFREYGLWNRDACIGTGDQIIKRRGEQRRREERGEEGRREKGRGEDGRGEERRREAPRVILNSQQPSYLILTIAGNTDVWSPYFCFNS